MFALSNMRSFCGTLFCTFNIDGSFGDYSPGPQIRAEIV